jgi:hypothetical protein
VKSKEGEEKGVKSKRRRRRRRRGSFGGRGSQAKRDLFKEFQD